MSRRILVIALVCLVVIGGSWAAWQRMSQARVPGSRTAVTSPTPAAAPVELPTPVAPVPEPAPERGGAATARSGRRAAQGLRYETDDKDDRFSAALGGLEVFEVDYLAKVLRVKLAKGKRYEFTDPGAANADRLFVFHRDVDKVRQRLKQGS